MKTVVKICPLYRIKVAFTIDMKHAYKKFGLVDDISPQNGGEVVKLQNDATGFYAIIMCVVPDKNNCPLQCAAHESIHAAWAVLNAVGVKISYENQEPLAYLADWMFLNMKKLIEQQG